MKGGRERIKRGDGRLEAVKDAIERFLMVVPNVPDESVPVGRAETANVEVRRVGAPRACSSSSPSAACARPRSSSSTCPSLSSAASRLSGSAV